MAQVPISLDPLSKNAEYHFMVLGIPSAEPGAPFGKWFEDVVVVCRAEVEVSGGLGEAMDPGPRVVQEAESREDWVHVDHCGAVVLAEVPPDEGKILVCFQWSPTWDPCLYKIHTENSTYALLWAFST